jgi:hypothetical protein
MVPAACLLRDRHRPLVRRERAARVAEQALHLALVVERDPHRRGVSGSDEAEVGDRRARVLAHEDVLRLEVAVDETGRVRGGEPASSLDVDLDDLAQPLAGARHARTVVPSMSSIATNTPGRRRRPSWS